MPDGALCGGATGCGGTRSRRERCSVHGHSARAAPSSRHLPPWVAWDMEGTPGLGQQRGFLKEKRVGERLGGRVSTEESGWGGGWGGGAGMEQEGEGLQPRVTGAPQPPALPPWPPLFSCPRPQGPGQNPCLDHCPMGWGEALTHRSSRASGEQPPFPGLPQSQGPRAGEKETWGPGGAGILRHTGHGGPPRGVGTRAGVWVSH